MQQLAKFAIEVREEDFVLTLEDEAGKATQYSATPEQLVEIQVVAVVDN